MPKARLENLNNDYSINPERLDQEFGASESIVKYSSSTSFFFFSSNLQSYGRFGVIHHPAHFEQWGSCDRVLRCERVPQVRGALRGRLAARLQHIVISLAGVRLSVNRYLSSKINFCIIVLIRVAEMVKELRPKNRFLSL
jgi:hypothetical protein